MQDNRPQEIDQPFVDLGWERMQALLDREMPVVAPVLPLWRRYAAAAAILLLLLGGGTVGWWMLSHRGSEPSLAGEIMPEAVQHVAGPDSSTPAETPATAGEAPRSGDAASPSPAAGRKRTVTPPPPAPPAAVPLAKKEQAPAPVVTQDGYPEAGEVANMETASEKADAPEVAPGAGPSFPALAGIEAMAPKVPALPGASLGEKASRRPANRIHLGVEGMAMAASGLAPSGGSLGLHAFRRFGESQWDLGTGLYFAAVAQDLVLTEGSSLEQATQREDLGTSGSAALPPVPAAIDTRFQYLSLPLMAQRHLGRHFRLEAGVQVNYMLASAENQSGTADYSFADPNSPVGPASPGFNLSSYADETVRLLSSDSGGAGISVDRMNTMDLGLTGGVTYLPHPRLGINLRYSYGFVDVVKSPDYQSYNRWLQLGLRYYIR